MNRAVEAAWHAVEADLTSAQELLRERRIPLALIVAGLWSYQNSLTGLFIFDDVPTIVKNPHLRHLWPLTDLLSPGQAGLTGRPLLGLTLALNYALSGLQVWSYHASNLLIHVLAALTLYGLLRRAFGRPPLQHRYGLRRAGWPEPSRCCGSSIRCRRRV